MNRAVRALSWEILARYRWLNAGGALYLVVACGVVALLPPALRSPQLGACLAIPMLVLAGGLVLSLVHGEVVDLRAAASGFPRRLFTLPVSSFLLASTPFVLGVVLMTLIWLVVAFGVLLPCGARILVVLPALVIVTTVAWMQASSWWPFPLPWVRSFLMIPGFYLLLVGPVVLIESGFADTTVAWGLGGLLVLNYGLTLQGVRLARRGTWCSETVQVDRGVLGTVSSLTPFSSSLRAQLWLEWRHLGRVGLVQTLILVLLLLPAVHFGELAWRRPYYLAAVGPLAEAMGSAWFSLSVLLLLPLAFSTIGVGDLGRLPASRGRYALPEFYATRASSIPEMIQARLIATALFVIGLWGEILLLGLGWAALAGHLPDMIDRLATLAGSPAAGLGLFAAAVVVACVVNWLVVIGGLWVGLSGRSWPVLLMLGVLLLGLVLGGMTLRGWQPSWYPWLVGLVLVGLLAKVAAVVWVCCRLLAWEFADGRQLAVILAAWLIVAGTLAGLAGWFLPGGWVTTGAVLLLLPLAQTLAAPLALAWNRHR